MQNIEITIESIIDGLAVTNFGMTPKKAKTYGLCIFCKCSALPKIESLDDLHNWEKYMLCPDCINGKGE